MSAAIETAPVKRRERQRPTADQIALLRPISQAITAMEVVAQAGKGRALVVHGEGAWRAAKDRMDATCGDHVHAVVVACDGYATRECPLEALISRHATPEDFTVDVGDCKVTIHSYRMADVIAFLRIDAEDIRAAVREANR